jgi:hypothetical protein
MGKQISGKTDQSYGNNLLSFEDKMPITDTFVKSQLLGWVCKKLHIRGEENSNNFSVLRYVGMI